MTRQQFPCLFCSKTLTNEEQFCEKHLYQEHGMSPNIQLIDACYILFHDLNSELTRVNRQNKCY